MGFGANFNCTRVGTNGAVTNRYVFTGYKVGGFDHYRVVVAIGCAAIYRNITAAIYTYAVAIAELLVYYVHVFNYQGIYILVMHHPKTRVAQFYSKVPYIGTGYKPETIGLVIAI